MKYSYQSLQLLKSELIADYRVLVDLFEKNRIMTDKLNRIEPDEFDFAGLGYTIHNLYNVMENYFFRIAKFFENNLPSEGWHKGLIDRMALDVQGVRPAFIHSGDSGKFHELRSFRHVFRNIYQSDLKPELLMAVNDKIPGILDTFKTAHDQFIEALDEISEGL